MKATTTVVHGSNTNKYDEAFMVSTMYPLLPLNKFCLHHICCREKLFNSLKSREGIVYLLDRSSYMINSIETVSLQTHDISVMKSGEV